MAKKQKNMMKKIIAVMAIVALSAGFVNISEAAISRIPSISSRTHGMMQERNRDRVHRNDKNNNNRNENHANAPKEESVKNTNVNDEQPQEATVTNKKENNNSRIGSRRNDVGSRKRETPAKIVRDIDRSHDATYDEDDRYKAQRESYFEDDGNGRIVDEQREIVEERRQIGATESDRERGRETIINRYDNESDRRGNRGNRDEGGVTVVINNNIPVENNIEVNVEAVNKNENNNDIKQESNTEVTNTNNNNNKNSNESKVEVPSNEIVATPKDKDETPKIPSNVKIPVDAYVYNGHSYYVFHNSISSWNEAKRYCEAYGGYLAIINNYAEDTVLYDYMISTGNESAYFGLRKSGSDWYWVNGQKAMYTNWSPDEPNNALDDEQYGMYYWKYKYTWNDGDFGRYVDIGENAFICEWDYLIPK